MNRKELAYLKGVMDGDGFVDDSNKNPRICLGVVNEGFAMRFSEALKAFGLIPRHTERTQKNVHKDHPRFRKYNFTSHFFYVRTTCKPEFIKLVRQFLPKTKGEKKLYIKGLYDSDGSFNQKKRTLALGNKKVILLENAMRYLKDLGIKARIYPPYKYQAISNLCTGDQKSVNSFERLIGLPRVFESG